MVNPALIKQLAEEHGTPLYYYDSKMVINSIKNIKQVFPDFNIIYSVKANPFQPLLCLMHEYGVGIDAASKNEVLDSHIIGYGPQDIYYSAPGKSRGDIEATMEQACIVADSLREIELIDEVAAKRNTVAEIGVRLNIPNTDMQSSRFEVMGGAASKFGIDPDMLLRESSRLSKLSHIKINGIHVYFGSQLMDEALIAANFSAISQAAMQVRKSFPLAYINYGGGFGVPYNDDECGKPNLHKVAGLIFGDDGTRTAAALGIRKNIELGRYLVAEAGWFIATIADVKESYGKTFVILDSGMNGFFRPKFTGQRHGIIHIKNNGGHAAPATDIILTGNTCTPLDVFYESVVLDNPQPGDCVAFKNAGAYGYSMSLLEFISFDKPKQIII